MSSAPSFLILMLLVGFITSSHALRVGRPSMLKRAAMQRSTVLSMSSAPAPEVRVRFAPSPTGSLHVGGARTALFNWLLARKMNGKFLVRVEDTDEARSTRESEKAILDDLRWLKLDWDEGPEVGGPHGPYRQSERKHIYAAAAEQLMAAGKAYRCFCTEEELEEKRLAAEAAGLDPKYDGIWRDAEPSKVLAALAAGKPYTVRFKVPAGKTVAFDDMVRGHVSWEAEAALGDFIILRSSGMPVYNFCVSVDDAAMRITHVIRAEEHLSNTLRQLLILEALGAAPPTYAHCSLILGADRSKLSKRHGATSVSQFAAQGFLPEAMLNYLANLGWNDGTNKELYSPAELTAAFDLQRIIKAPAVFDMVKLTWINGQHLRALSAEQIQPMVLKAMGGAEGPLSDDMITNSITNTNTNTAVHFPAFLAAASKVAQRDMEVVADTTRLLGNCLLYDLDGCIASDPHAQEVLSSASLGVLVAALTEDFASGAMPAGAEDAFEERWKAYMKALGSRLGLKGKALYHPVRFLLTGRMSGPEVGDQLRLLGLAEGIVRADYPMVSLADRIKAIQRWAP